MESKEQNNGAAGAPTIDLWTLASKVQSAPQNSDQANPSEGAGILSTGNNVTEKTFVFIGDKMSGKSSLIAKLLDEPLKDDMKETTALDFRYGTRVKEEKKQRLNIYELGGGRTLASLLQAPLNSHALAAGDIVVCIVIDLANPGASVDTLLFWLATIREQLTKSAQDIQSKLPPQQQQQFDQNQQRIRAAWEKHEDRQKVNPMPVSVVVVGSKFDVFANQFETVKRKQVCLALRYICHANGCDLVFGSIKEKLPAQLFKSMLTLRSSPASDSQAPSKVERDHNQPLNVYAGSDTFAQIGEPEGAGMRRNVAFEKLWQEIIESQIPKVATSAMKDPNQILGDMRRYHEEKVDSMRQQKDEELEQYKKEIERAKRFESQKAGVAGAGVGTDKLVVKRKAVATSGTGTATQGVGSMQAAPKRRIQQ